MIDYSVCDSYNCPKWKECYRNEDRDKDLSDSPDVSHFYGDYTDDGCEYFLPITEMFIDADD